MKERIQAVTGQDGMWVMTFHSFCARVLRNDADKLGHNRNFSIYGEAESYGQEKDYPLEYFRGKKYCHDARTVRRAH